MEEDKDGLANNNSHRDADCIGVVLATLLSLIWLNSAVAREPKHFDLPPGDATVMLNEFSRQADLQVLFDFALMRGTQTHRIVGDFDPAVALTSLLAGTGLAFEFVNDRTLAVTPGNLDDILGTKSSRLRKWWGRVTKKRPAQTVPKDDLEQVLVAADSGRDAPPPVGAAVIHLTRVDIERSGFATTQDLIRTLPEVFGGGPSEDTQFIGREASTNPEKGSGVNLRGLDAGATLVLIDGRRIAPGGTAGIFSDVSNIPLSAVDHIDILPDGSSARYGADAIGGVVNFVMRHDFIGAETQARAGGVTSGSLGERQFSQLLGTHWDSGNAVASFEYYQRDALASRDRAQATSDLRPFGGTNFDTMYGSPGTIMDGIQTWAIPRGQNGSSLKASDLVAGTQNLYDQFKGSTLLPRQERWSAFGTLRNEVSDGLDVFVDALFTNRTMRTIPTYGNPLVLTVPSTNPFYLNPTGGSGPVTVLYGTAADFGSPREVNRLDIGNIALGFCMDAVRGWSVSGSAGYAYEKQHSEIHGLVDHAALYAALADPDPATAFNPFGDGSHTNPATLAAIVRAGLYTSNSNFKLASLAASGPIVPLSGGDLKITLGMDYRDQSFDAVIPPLSATPGYDPRSSLHRKVAAAFTDIVVPVIGTANSRQLAHRLEFEFGARYEHFSDIGAAAIPEIGLLWAPASNLSVRGTWTKSFRAPNLTDLVQKDSMSVVTPLPDASSPTGVTTALVAEGKNADLRAERATSWTIGADLTPASAPGLSIALTYFNTKYAGRIEDTIFGPDVLARPELAWLVNRNVTSAERNDICSRTTFSGAAGACLSAPIGAVIDDRLHNVALLKTQGIDLLGKYALTSSLGKFELGVNGTYLLRYSEIKSPGSPELDLVSTQNNPIDLRLRGSLSWERQGMGISTYLNYDDSYRDIASQPARKVNSWTTADLRLSYENDRNDLAWLAHTRFALSIQNVFDTPPPFLNNHVGIGYDQENADLLGRIISLDIRKHW
jgi:outer membrane receptor protein involved in Fe transport